MRPISTLIRWLGSLHFALFLIAATALFAITGTILEAKTSSHRYAAIFTYSNPLFMALLGGYFINILLSALSRYPYKKKHIPFLITHLGMLILLAGAFIKGKYGLQGNLRLLEGGTARTVMLPETYAVQVFTPGQREEIALLRQLRLQGVSQSVQLDLVGYAPHSHIQYESWVKQGQVFINGLKPFPILPETATLSPSTRIRIKDEVWNAYAFQTEHPDTLRDSLEKSGTRPALLFAETEAATFVTVFPSKGETSTQVYTKERPQKLAVYDQGYGGYCAFFQGDDFTLETPVQCRCRPQTAHPKIEELRPQLTVRTKSDKGTQFITLPFEPHGDGLKWPILGGSALLRFQPALQTLPYSVRLKQARQITYPHSGQPFSYEADVVFTSLKTGEQITKTLSMNHVHETWEGYRFYLANMTPLDAGAVKEVYIVVNHDPAKYLLTYPGALLMSLGILLLFWWNPYKT